VQPQGPQEKLDVEEEEALHARPHVISESRKVKSFRPTSILAGEFSLTPSVPSLSPDPGPSTSRTVADAVDVSLPPVSAPTPAAPSSSKAVITSSARCVLRRSRPAQRLPEQHQIQMTVETGRRSTTGDGHDVRRHLQRRGSRTSGSPPSQGGNLGASGRLASLC
jgi:hypothetical protein